MRNSAPQVNGDLLIHRTGAEITKKIMAMRKNEKNILLALVSASVWFIFIFPFKLLRSCMTQPCFSPEPQNVSRLDTRLWALAACHLQLAA